MVVYSPSKEEQSPSEDRYGILWKKCVAQKSNCGIGRYAVWTDTWCCQWLDFTRMLSLSIKWWISWKEHDGHSIGEDSKRMRYTLYNAVIKCTERGAVARVLRTEAAGQSGHHSLAYTLAPGLSCFSHPNIKYFSSWFSTVMGVTKLTHTWNELAWRGQGLQDWVSSPLCSLSQISFWIFLPALSEEAQMLFGALPGKVEADVREPAFQPTTVLPGWAICLKVLHLLWNPLTPMGGIPWEEGSVTLPRSLQSVWLCAPAAPAMAQHLGAARRNAVPGCCLNG